MAVERQVRMETSVPPILGKEKNRASASSTRFGDWQFFWRAPFCADANG